MKIPFYLSVFFLALIHLALLSCATVTFDVEHPPLVDLRGVNSITVIPLEWNSSFYDAYLANRVTDALLSGLKRGNINIVDPYSLESVYLRNYSKYADVYIFGKIVNVRVYDNIQRREDRTWSDPRIITTTTRTVLVDIEYTYCLSVNNRNLGHFYKTASASKIVEQTRRASEGPPPAAPSVPRQAGRGNAQRNAQRDAQRDAQRNFQRDAPRDSTRVRNPRDEWTNSIAVSAASEFSGTMDDELGPWITTEKRRVRGRTSGDPDTADAKTLVKQGRYNLALEKFTAVYQKTGSVFSGYNTAVLLAANNRFTEALALLQKIDRTINEAGEKSPYYLKNEISKMTDYINGLKILESTRAIPSAVVNVPAPPKTPAAPVTYRTVDVTDDGGRLLTQTTYNNRNETVSVKKYAWQGERITSVTTTEGSNIKKTEYEYNASGGKTAQRDYNNGILERQVITQGNREIEEIYLNGSVALRAVWENGVKISEERIPAG